MHPPKLSPGVARDVTRSRVERTIAPHVLNDPTKKPPIIIKGNCTRFCTLNPLTGRYRCVTIC
jgi:hypothetical protein